MPNANNHTKTSQSLSGGQASQKNKQLPVPMALKLLRLGFKLGGQIMPEAAGSFAYKLWFTPTRFKMPAREKEAFTSAKMAKHQINDDEIVTFNWGQENTNLPLVLLVHGWSGRATQMGPLFNRYSMQAIASSVLTHQHMEKVLANKPIFMKSLTSLFSCKNITAISTRLSPILLVVPVLLLLCNVDLQQTALLVFHHQQQPVDLLKNLMMLCRSRKKRLKK